MDEKVFELLEKMYVEMQEMKSNMATKDDLFNVERGLKLDLVRLENKMDQNHKALYDGYKLTYEKLESLEEKVNEIDKKVDRHDVEIRVIRNAR